MLILNDRQTENYHFRKLFMPCPKCGCKVCYPLYDPDDLIGEYEDMERCANCGYSF